MFFEHLPEVISTFGDDIDSTIFLIYYITGFFFIVLEIYLLYIIFRYRKNSGPAESPSKGESRTEVWTILIAAVIMLVLDLAIDIKAAETWNKIKIEMPKPDLQVRVLGQQFSWSFRYPGIDGVFDTADDVVVVNDLKLPIHQKVHLNLRSRDVIHSLFLPSARFKQDILPGREIKGWLELTKAGETPLICAELCGAAHTIMKGTLTAMPREKFYDWLEKESESALKENS